MIYHTQGKHANPIHQKKNLHPPRLCLHTLLVAYTTQRCRVYNKRCGFCCCGW